MSSFVAGRLLCKVATKLSSFQKAKPNPKDYDYTFAYEKLASKIAQRGLIALQVKEMENICK